MTGSIVLQRMCMALSVLIPVSAQPAFAIDPESGIYWSLTRKGEALVVERQGGIASIIFYSYDDEGRPQFFIGAASLSDDGRSEGQRIEGLFPVTRLLASLQRPEAGPVIASSEQYTISNPSPVMTPEVGTIVVDFEYLNYIRVHIVLFDEQRRVVEEYVDFMRRFNFGYAGLGKDRLGEAVYESPENCFRDLTGEWVFVDKSDPSRPAWRLDLSIARTEPDRDQLSCNDGLQNVDRIVYVDAISGGELRCVVDERPLDTKPNAGCEYVTADGVAGFSFFILDIGLDSIVGSLGGLPTAEERVLRRQERVLGFRTD